MSDKEEKAPSLGGPVVLVEEQGIFRSGLRAVLEGGGFEVVGEYSSPEAALSEEDVVGELAPQTVVLCSLTAEGWEEMAHRLLLASPDLRIVGVVDAVGEQSAIEALSHGLVACVERTLTPDQWVERVTAAQEGRLSASRTMMLYRGAARYVLVTLSEAPKAGGLETLTPVMSQRERVALANVSEGVPLESIEERMGLSERGVHEVLESACRKLVVRERLEGVVKRAR